MTSLSDRRVWQKANKQNYPKVQISSIKLGTLGWKKTGKMVKERTWFWYFMSTCVEKLHQAQITWLIFLKNVFDSFIKYVLDILIPISQLFPILLASLPPATQILYPLLTKFINQFLLSVYSWACGPTVECGWLKRGYPVQNNSTTWVELTTTENCHSLRRDFMSNLFSLLGFGLPYAMCPVPAVTITVNTVVNSCSSLSECYI